MKKLIVTVTATLTAVVVNAANCNWSTTSLNNEGSDVLNSGTYWLVALGADAGASSAFKVNSDGTYDFGSYTVADTGSVAAGGGVGGTITGLSEADNGKYYALVIWDGAADGYYGVAEDSISGIVDAPPSDANIMAFDNTGWGGFFQPTTAVVASGGGSGGGSTIPEPTSGLLLALGLAGLALKRKVA